MVLDEVELWGGGKRDTENITPFLKRELWFVHLDKTDVSILTYGLHKIFYCNIEGGNNPKRLKHSPEKLKPNNETSILPESQIPWVRIVV